MATDDEEKFDSAEKFLHALLPTDSAQKRLGLLTAFRGHADASWKLLPSAHRSSSWIKSLCPNRFMGAPPQTAEWWASAEHEVLYDFMVSCDLAGQPVPEDSHLNRAPPTNFRDWPEKRFFAQLAFAQHHRVPTRLLDWTLSPLVAAFHAAFDFMERSRRYDEHRRLLEMLPETPERMAAIEVLKPSSEMCVWRIFRAPGFQNCGIDFFTPPAAPNPFLVSQQGMFTVVRGSYVPGTPGTELEVVYPEKVSRIKSRDSSGREIRFSPLKKFVLATSSCGRLLGLLKHLNIRPATVWPSIEGAVRDVLDYPGCAEIDSHTLEWDVTG